MGPNPEEAKDPAETGKGAGYGRTAASGGCAKPESLTDWTIEGLWVLPAGAGSRLHGESGIGGAPARESGMSLRQIRAAADSPSAGSRDPQGLYYRDLLSWRK